MHVKIPEEGPIACGLPIRDDERWASEEGVAALLYVSTLLSDSMPGDLWG